jgi:RHH-type transcriptional regulator, proline utilization regulon repressor / proline dehydrogenase / delta 1-pyrroline-5-carboxylate dehydrogenase
MTAPFVHREAPPAAAPLRAAMGALIRADEGAALTALVGRARFSTPEREKIEHMAGLMVERVRQERRGAGGIEALLHEYSLSSQEGVVLMCLAEALLRVPDPATADRLIRDKLGGADWERHVGQSDSVLVNASTWGLMLTGRIVRLDTEKVGDLGGWLKQLVARSGEPVIRQAVREAMRIVGRQFVMGRTIDEALSRAREAEARGDRHSYDMLGESARTQDDADRYQESYLAAIAAIGRAATGAVPAERPGISVKLSALHPRYEAAQRHRATSELVPRVLALAEKAAEARLGFCIDAEEVDRLDLSFDVIEAVALDKRLVGWDGFGLAVQSYQKRAAAAIEWLADLAWRARRRLMVRLVKGAYWDSEIKRSQEGGFAGYAVFTRKVSTDVSYLACARRLLAEPERFYAQFASHNAHTVAAIAVLAGGRGDFEYQRLHGMGEALYGVAARAAGIDAPCRIYAPVGGHEDLLAYLVRRLLENGANTSFVNRIVDESLPVDRLIADPVEEAAALPMAAHPKIPLPRDLFRPERANSLGMDLNDPAQLAELAPALAAAAAREWAAAPIVGGRAVGGRPEAVFDPADRRRRIGTTVEADPAAVAEAVARAAAAQAGWDATSAGQRANILDRAADLFEEHRVELMALCVREAGKCLPDAVAEVREAVDFCRYYAARARADFGAPKMLPGPTGERNEISLAGRGVFACISPWNFPLAIFTGQVVAALAAGNAVAAKPAEQTPLIAARAVELLHEAGVPADVLHLLPGRGEVVGQLLVSDPRIAGVAFTGGTETAQAINRQLAARGGPMAALIAETGGQNVMIADSTALPEQVVADAVRSAFNAAGQRCSALRVLCVQRDIADKVIAMLAGAMAELVVGDPGLMETDVGPVIDDEARQMLAAHAARMAAQGRRVGVTSLRAASPHGYFFAPHAFEIDRLERLEREVFGPILHVVRFEGSRLDQVVDAANATGYGLTFGIHSRIDDTVRRVRARVRAGNLYVNRNMIGAVVGMQPFGGEGLSGTGPKAGGPRYLHRFAVERTVSTDTTAAGGNAALLSLDDEEQ